MGHNFGVAAFFVVLLALLGQYSCGRELRPSDHGLAYQEESSPPVRNGSDAKQMVSFFGATTTSSSPAVQLPEAKNISDTWWSARADDGRSSGDAGGRDHVRLGFLVASAVCGLTGVVMLAISGVVLIFRLQKQKQKQKLKLEAEMIPSTSAQNSTVPRDNSHAAT
ncbi:hypothetical protein ABFS83_13G180200 [Erythranthe nasuta]